METIIPNSTPFLTLLDSFLQFLENKKYTPNVLNNYRRTLSHIDDYMKEQELVSYSPEIGNRYCEWFLSSHRIGHDRTGAVKVMVRRLNEYCNSQGYSLLEAKPTDTFSADTEATISSYLSFCRENGNKDSTQKRKEHVIRQFLHKVFKECQDLKSLQVCHIQRVCITTKTKDDLAIIRAFLKYLCQNGFLEKDLSTIIPHSIRRFRLPSTYTVEEIHAVEKSIDRTTSIGKRDYAMLLLASRYGIRAGDIVRLTFGNLDFTAKRLSFIQQKTGNNQSMALIPEVENALQEYISKARPETDESHIFLRMNAPFTPITTSVLRFELSKYFQKAGVSTEGKKHGTHVLRSSLATSMVNDNIPYEEVRKILGHTDPNAIKHYARIDKERLRYCAIDVPTPSGSFLKFLNGGRK